jgi:leucyl aminopeptidase
MLDVIFVNESARTTARIAIWSDEDATPKPGGISEGYLKINRGHFGAITPTVDDTGVPVWLVGVGKLADWTKLRIEQLGAHIARFAETSGADAVQVDATELTRGKMEITGEEAALAVALGATLGAYTFEQYREKANALKPHKTLPLERLLVITTDANSAAAAWKRRCGVLEGAFLVRDLVNEPPNVLTPKEFARRIQTLTVAGLDVEILSQHRCEELGMGALSAVARGSRHEGALALIRWRGANEAEAPVAFAGKGVTFDSGGISLKPGDGMQEMKADMGGAAAIVGAMLAIARRRARANVVAAVGLVENMPSGDAYRPGDIIKAMSGHTIEITNTDAEGRLVLCDAMHYLQATFAPRALIDVATLTGVAMMALGYAHAAFFSNDDALARAVEIAGRGEFEPVWRLPLGAAYDVAIDSKVADMKNAAGRLGGAITAAQFLQRFVFKGTPWAHIDMGGAVQVPSGDFKNDDPRMPSWATGWGVRLLDRLVEDHFEPMFRQTT